MGAEKNMSKINKNKSFLGGVLIGVVSSTFIIAIALGLLYLKNWPDPNTELLDFQYGQEWNGFDVLDVNNQKFSLTSFSEKTLVAYLSNSCKSCIDTLPFYNQIKNIFKDEVSIAIIWYDKIPLNLLESNMIDSNVNFSLDKKLKLAADSPTYFIIEDKKISFKDTDMKNVVDFLFSSTQLTNEQLSQNASEYLFTTYFNKSDKSKLIYFYLEDCSDCEKADKLIKENQIADKFQILQIYTADSSSDSSKMIDQYDLFSNAYKIDWYPSFIVSKDEKISFVGECSDEELLNYFDSTN